MSQIIFVPAPNRKKHCQEQDMQYLRDISMNDLLPLKLDRWKEN